ncbi:transferrin-binding protein-like solute binding protein [Vreelandella titanicae]|uniref:transferrin-binding protein-like solute binding protein n=1 Tax=Vreelandella titanicae TaxID=664683 RepID=UPI001141EAA1|nr:transferrin-binding protein-like solute binding protein [Halomonas titanicae]
MQRIDNNGSVLKLSLLALAIVAMAGCSSNDSSSQPLNPGDGAGGGGSGSDGGGADGGDSDDSDSGSGGGGQGFTYRTINPANDILVGEKFSLDSVSINATPSSSGVAINQGPEVDFEATIEVLAEAPDGQSRIRLNAPASGVENRDFTESDQYPYDFDNDEENEVKLRSQGEDAEQFLNGSLNYAVFGDWLIRNSDGDSDVSFFAGGYDTRSSDMPMTGTASYSGVARGEVIINNGQAHALIGQANLGVDFTDKTMNGSLSHMTAREYDTDAARPWHDVNLSGGLDDSGNRFAGITEIGSSPGNAASLSTDSEGQFNGRFYGPDAAEAAAVWSIKDPNGSAAYGAFGVKKD